MNVGFRRAKGGKGLLSRSERRQRGSSAQPKATRDSAPIIWDSRPSTQEKRVSCAPLISNYRVGKTRFRWLDKCPRRRRIWEVAGHCSENGIRDGVNTFAIEGKRGDLRKNRAALTKNGAIRGGETCWPDRREKQCGVALHALRYRYGDPGSGVEQEVPTGQTDAGLRRIRARTRDGYIPVLFRRATHPRERRGAVLQAQRNALVVLHKLRQTPAGLPGR